MNEEEGFLNAIAANPDDDTVRLVYADWLEENDRPETARGIRAMVAGTLSEKGFRRLLRAVTEESCQRSFLNPDGTPRRMEVVRVRKPVRKPRGHFWVYTVDSNDRKRWYALLTYFPLFDRPIPASVGAPCRTES